MLQSAKRIKMYFSMLITGFWSNTIINQQKQEYYINLQTDLLDNTLTSRPIQLG